MTKQRLSISISLVIFFLMSGLAPVFGHPETVSSMKKNLVVGVFTQPPFSIKEDDGTWSGITVDLWQEVARVMGIEYQLKEINPLERFKLVTDGAADTLATATLVSETSRQVVDFSDAYLADNLCVAVNSQRRQSIFEVMRLTLVNWGMLLLFGGALCVVLAGATALWLLEHQGDSEHYKGKTKAAFGKSVYWATTLMMGRELPKSIGWSTYPPQTVAGRLFGVAWTFAGMILFSLFTAGVASEFTAERIESSIHNVEDLRHLKVGAIKGAAYLKNLDYQRIKYAVYTSPFELVEALANKRIDAAIFGYSTLSYYAKNTFNGKIRVLNFSLSQGFFAFPIRPESPLRRPINDALAEVMGNAKWHKILSEYGTVSK